MPKLPKLKILEPKTKEWQDRLLPKEAAEYCRITIWTLERLRNKGGGPRYIKAVKKILYDRADLDRWLESNKRGSTASAPGIRPRRPRQPRAPAL